MAVWQALQTCWSADVFLLELAHNFFKLSLQLLKRYALWATEGLTKWDLTVDLLIRMETDAEALISATSSSLKEQIVSLIGSSSQEVVGRGLDLCVKGLESLHTQILRCLVDLLVSHCSSGLSAVPRIKTAYQMTGRAAPKHHSVYVTSMFEPLKRFTQLYAETEAKETQTTEAKPSKGVPFTNALVTV